MWKPLKHFFRKKIFTPRPKNDKVFALVVQETIDLIGQAGNIGNHEEFITFLRSNDILEKDAVEIATFLPIAFVRQWFPMGKWPDTYLLFSGRNSSVKKRYADTKSFKIIWEVSTKYFNDNPNQATILKIGGRSANFHAMNNLMLQDPKLTVEEIKFTETVIHI